MPSSKHVFDDSIYNSKFSLQPLYEAMKKNISQGNPGAKSLYGDIIDKIEAHPELLGKISDFTQMEEYRDLVDSMLSTLFPPTAHINDSLFAVSFPFKFQAVYASGYFKRLFLKPGSDTINVPENLIGENLADVKIMNAYGMILKKYYGYDYPEEIVTVYPFADPVTGLTKYLELNVDTRFIEVNPVAEMPVMPDDVICRHTNRIMILEDLKKSISLSDFVFEGMAIIRVKDITSTEIVSLIKNELLNSDSFSDMRLYHRLQEHIRNLLRIRELKIGITPFLKINDHYIFSKDHNSNSLLYKELANLEQVDEISECCFDLFRDIDVPIVFENFSKESVGDFEYIDLYRRNGAKNLILAPLKDNGTLIGVLEIYSEKEDVLKHQHIGQLKEIIPLFALAMKKTGEALDNRIDTIIKEKFTAVQPAVEWKFIDVALNYIAEKEKNENAKIERITFEDVYPLYGAIDIRNSSTERAGSIQLDLIEQLQMTLAIIKKARTATFFPLLNEIEYKIEKYITSAADTLLSDEEIMIQDFLQNQIIAVFDYLKRNVPDVAEDVDAYFRQLNPQLKMIYNHRKDYEESISFLNDKLARFIDKEQVSAQKVFPHYFERYVTDGVEFNIYIGQSITVRKKFDELHLRNLKMWQLSTLAKAALLSKKLETEIRHPLRTTQLILAHSIPISISFRTTERKFDVDGAYNIRYEIIKKRIDKVRIKSTNERLTQPDKLAIVYSQPKEAAEYREYIEFLQNQGIIKPGIEEFELEELQGVVGLKALRVEVNFGQPEGTGTKIELSTTTTDKLLGK